VWLSSMLMNEMKSESCGLQSRHTFSWKKIPCWNYQEGILICEYLMKGTILTLLISCNHIDEKYQVVRVGKSSYDWVWGLK